MLLCDKLPEGGNAKLKVLNSKQFSLDSHLMHQHHHNKFLVCIKSYLAVKLFLILRSSWWLVKLQPFNHETLKFTTELFLSISMYNETVKVYSSNYTHVFVHCGGHSSEEAVYHSVGGFN